jgi:hypothetical protein
VTVDAKALFLANNDLVQNQLQRICSDLTDEQVVFEHDAVDERGIGNIVSHLYGNIVYRTTIITGGQPDPNPIEPPRTAVDLMAFIDRTHDRASELIAQISEEALGRTVTLRPGREVSGSAAMIEGFAHAFRHVGNILDARHLGGFETHALG